MAILGHGRSRSILMMMKVILSIVVIACLIGTTTVNSLSPPRNLGGGLHQFVSSHSSVPRNIHHHDFSWANSKPIVPSSSSPQQQQPQQQQQQQQQQQLRRSFLQISSTSLLVSLMDIKIAQAIQAVGGGEMSCRAAGNCWETGEWDGAVGWTWGGKDRCDALTDPTCGAGGKLVNLVGKPVPRVPGDASQIFTHVVVIQLDIGRRKESGILRLGLYKESSPPDDDLIQQFLDFVSPQGLTTTSLAAAASSENSLGEFTVPVALTRGGMATWVTPGKSIELGVPSQLLASARFRPSSRNLQFVPQPRPHPHPEVKPKKKEEGGEDGIPSHDLPGLLSIPQKGLGYASGSSTAWQSDDDECFQRAFLITNAPAPELDKSRRVIGQILDANSMAFLSRLSNIPTQRGFRGILPGQEDGPPLPKVTVRDIVVATVVNKPRQEDPNN